MWHVYVLWSESSKLHYVGITQNIERRLPEHNSGKSKFTSGHSPWKLIYSEQCEDSKAARSREKYLKSAAGKRFIEKQLRAGSLPD